MKKIFLLLNFLPLISFSQSHDENHRKYWYYKSRLNNDFVKVGTGVGESIPFNQRGIGLNKKAEALQKENEGVYDKFPPAENKYFFI